jgi:sulfite exporter TauE/SafE
MEVLLALAVALVMGLRHASDPDHLVAVTSMVAADDGDVRGAASLGVAWGVGHAAMLLAVGLPLIVLETSMPGWLERGAEMAIGLVIVALGARVIMRWLRPRRTYPLRSRRQAFGIGLLHGLAGSGAVVVLLIAAVPNHAEAAATLLVFAPATILSMTAFTGAFAWLLDHAAHRVLLMPAMGVFGVLFGLWYAGLS